MLLKDVFQHLFLALLEWSLEYGLFKDFLDGATLEMNCSDSARESENTLYLPVPYAKADAAEPAAEIAVCCSRHRIRSIVKRL